MIRLKSDKTKNGLAMALFLLIGFGSGFAIKDSCDKNNTAKASETVSVPVQRVKDGDIAKSNQLLAPHLWDVYIDPLWVPIDFAIRPSPLVPLVSFPMDVPKIQTVNGDKDLRVIVQVPGMTDKDVNVKVGEHALTIKAHKTKEQKDKSLFETVDESFQQTVSLPCRVNADKVQATVKDGVLTVSLPKVSTEAKTTEQASK